MALSASPNKRRAAGRRDMEPPAPADADRRPPCGEGARREGPPDDRGPARKSPKLPLLPRLLLLPPPLRALRAMTGRTPRRASRVARAFAARRADRSAEEDMGMIDDVVVCFPARFACPLLCVEGRGALHSRNPAIILAWV